MPKSEFYFLGRFIVRTNKSYRNDFYFKLKSRYTMYGQKSHSAKMVYLTTSDVIEYLTDCLVWNKWTINKSPIISNETKLKSIFISVFVVSLDISKSAYWNLHEKYLHQSLAWSRPHRCFLHATNDNNLFLNSGCILGWFLGW